MEKEYDRFKTSYGWVSIPKRIFCPKCKSKVKYARSYNRDTNTFSEIFNWMYCKKCKGQILTKDCKRKGDE